MPSLVAPVKYQLKYIDFSSNEVIINDWFKLDFTRSEGSIGYLYLDLPDIYPYRFFKKDAVIEVYRSIGGYGYYLEGETGYLIRAIRYKTDENGNKLLHLLCHDGISILDRRIVPYPSETDQSRINMGADDALKQLVTDNIISPTDTERSIPTKYFYRDTKYSQCPVIIQKEFAYRKLLPLMQEICDDSKAGGSYLTFDVVRGSSNFFLFKTYVNTRGRDRGITSGSPLVFSLEAGNLSYVTVANDYSEERNFIYAGGRGQDSNRVIATASDPISIAESPFSRWEDWIDATDVENPDAVQSEADTRLHQASQKVVINAHLQQTVDCMYGLHYGFGDIVNINYHGFVIDVHIDTVSITCDSNSVENVKVYGRNLEDTEY